MLEFAGKHIFVAGGSSGINLGIAQAFARAEARVSILSRNQEKITTALQTLRDAGAQGVSGFPADVRQFEAVSASFELAVAEHGLVDVLISGAAGNFLAPAAELSSNGFRTVIDIDLQGTFHVLRAAWPHLRKPGASVLNISAAQSWLPTPMQVHVCAAKAGIDQITRTTAMEWGPSGVRVNSIAPGPITGTEGMARLAPTEESVKAWTQAVPLRRFGTLEDIAQAALWINSSQAAYVNGVVLPIDGGLALGGSSAIGAAIAPQSTS